MGKTVKKIAIVHDWLNGMRGGEKVLEAILDSVEHWAKERENTDLKIEIFTLVCESEKISEKIKKFPIHTSALQGSRFSIMHYRHFLPLLPTLIERFDLAGFDAVISSSHCVAKGVRRPKGVPHISYVHAPMRYMWFRFDDYFGEKASSFAVRMAAKMFRRYLQDWDFRVSQSENVDVLIANSFFISKQIEKFYGRSSRVIWPFAEQEKFLSERKREDFYLYWGAFAPQKRVDIAIEACAKLKRKLIVVGSGQEQERLKNLVLAYPDSQIKILDSVSDQALSDLVSKARAFIFSGVEDFGIVFVEALAGGLPVIYFNEGGATEIVSAQCGVSFEPQSIEGLCDGILRFEKSENAFEAELLRARAKVFSRTEFVRKFSTELKNLFS